MKIRSRKQITPSKRLANDWKFIPVDWSDLDRDDLQEIGDEEYGLSPEDAEVLRKTANGLAHSTNHTKLY